MKLEKEIDEEDGAESGTDKIVVRREEDFMGVGLHLNRAVIVSSTLAWAPKALFRQRRNIEVGWIKSRARRVRYAKQRRKSSG